MRLSYVAAVLGTAASVLGLTVDRIYAEETDNWAAQAMGQDVANLVVMPVLAVAAFLAERGSLRAALVWLGALVYTAYAYALYAIDVHFGPLFHVYVAVLGLSTWALIGGFAGLDPARLHRPSAGISRAASWLLIVLPSAFVALWLLQDVPAAVEGTTPDSLVDVGLVTNPVHVLDLALFLPAALAAGVLLRRGRVWGVALAPVMLVAMAGISLGIVSLTVVSAVQGIDSQPAVAVVIGALAVVEASLAGALLRQVAD